MELQLCAELAAHVNARTRSIGVALTICTVPAAGTPTFSAKTRWRLASAFTANRAAGA